jgi:hypothetical protein
MSACEMVSRHVQAALAEAAKLSISDDVVARCLLSEAIRLFKAAARSTDDIAAELTAATDNLDDDTLLVFMRP